MNILIADDNAINLKHLRAVLAAEGHRVFCAADGVEALALLDREQIQVVISDILMPRMDGYRLCLEVRKSPRLKTLPLIIYTSTYTSASDEQAAMDLGADLFIKKPAPAKELLSALRTAMREGPRRQLKAGSRRQEMESLQQYSQGLVARLEEKNLELEAQTESLRKSEAEAKKSREQLRALAGRLEASREQERIRVSRDIHDGLGEMLTAIEMGLAWMRALLSHKYAAGDREKLLERINALCGLTGGTADRVRKLCTRLRPAVLDDLGLVPAIEWQTHEFQTRTNIRCETKFEDKELTASPDQATAIFRILQEILTNVARHAHASKVRVLLKRGRANVILEVRDNGKGIRPEQLAGSKSFGLLGMRERAALLGGNVEIRGQPGKGTTATVTIPVAGPRIAVGEPP